MSKANGYVLYRGPSKLNGKPIRFIVTNYRRASKNPKTGDMLQSWIMPEGNVLESFRNNEDESVCGDCKLKGSVKGKRICYVNLFGPMGVDKGDQNGSYSSEDAPQSHKPIRLGSWGDPAAIPVRALRKAISISPSWTGYTHQWDKGKFQYLKKYCMASTDSLEEYRNAKRKGWRSFRVLKADDTLQPNEIWCPEYCADCNLCKGTSSNSSKDIAIRVHGCGSGNFERMEV